MGNYLVGAVGLYLLCTTSALASSSPCPPNGQPPSPSSTGSNCEALRSLGQALCRSDYMDIVDGQICDDQRTYFDTVFKSWTADPRNLTIVIYIHGGLVDAEHGLAGAANLDPVLRATYPASNAVVVPYYFIYHVGPVESVLKGDRERGLFQLYDNAQLSVAERFANTSQLRKARLADDRDHDVMTDREDWMRFGLPPMSIVGKNGSLAWAYMKQSILDGLDMTDPYMPQAQPGQTVPKEDAPVDASAYLDGPCLEPTAAELDPWPHIVRNKYRWQDAGARDFLCRLGRMINQRPKARATNIILVGHSTGSIYVTQFIRKAQKLWTCGRAASQKFSVIFLAPAVSYQDFDRLAMEAPDRIAQIRIFTMTDEKEKADKVLEAVVGPKFQALADYYDHSLLYAVSGIFEPNADEPLLGMDRFLSPDLWNKIALHASGQVTLDQLAEMHRVQDYINRYPGGSRAVFALSPTAGPPFASAAVDHGAFPTDCLTRQSLKELIGEVATGVPWGQAEAGIENVHADASQSPPALSAVMRCTKAARHS